MVLLSDGDNNYNGNYAWQSSPLSPHTYQSWPCRPTPSNCSNVSGGSGSCTAIDDQADNATCGTSYKRERQLDKQTWDVAKAIEADGVEIFVVAFGVCSSNSTTYTQAQCNDGRIGNTDSDTTADQRLLKCIASSAAGTNDHYYFATSASQIGTIFTAIATQIAHRLIE
jgi:hypothetical protein